MKRRARNKFEELLGHIGIEGIGIEEGHPITASLFVLSFVGNYVAIGVLTTMCLNAGTAVSDTPALLVMGAWMLDLCVLIVARVVCTTPSAAKLDAKVAAAILQGQDEREAAHLRGEAI